VLKKFGVCVSWNQFCGGVLLQRESLHQWCLGEILIGRLLETSSVWSQ